MNLGWKGFGFLCVGFLLLVAVYFGPSAYRKSKIDSDVDRMCATDGGVKVYERAPLPAESFDRFGTPLVPLSTWKTASSSPYVLEEHLQELIAGDERGRGSPGLIRSVSKVIRASDKKIMGEAVSYYRIGGDPEGPWHISHYTGCTKEPGKKLTHAIFFKGS